MQWLVISVQFIFPVHHTELYSDVLTVCKRGFNLFFLGRPAREGDGGHNRWHIVVQTNLQPGEKKFNGPTHSSMFIFNSFVKNGKILCIVPMVDVFFYANFTFIQNNIN